MTADLDNELHSDPSSLEQEESSIDIQFSLWHTFKSHIPRLILTIFCDVVLPLIIFLLLQKRIKSVYALLIAGTPPLVMIFLKAIISRTFDALGFLVLMGFAISAIVALITHNYIVLLLEKSFVTGLISIIFGVTLIPFRCCQHRCRWRPLAYYLYQDLLPTKRAEVGLPDSLFDTTDKPINERCEDELSVSRVSRKAEVAQVYEWIYIHFSSFRVSCYLITSIWSIGFLFEFLARLILILIHLSVNKIVIYANIILSTITVVCIILTIICITKERKQTLASIKQWKEEYFKTQQQQCRQPDLHVWVVTNDFDVNNRIYEMNTYSF